MNSKESHNNVLRVELIVLRLQNFYLQPNKLGGPHKWGGAKKIPNLKTFERLNIGMDFLADAVLATACLCKIHSKHKEQNRLL